MPYRRISRGALEIKELAETVKPLTGLKLGYEWPQILHEPRMLSSPSA